MPDYDFRALSPIDFEALTRDLLQAEFGVLFESFTPGRDGGVDFRYSPVSGPQWILQSKHYAASGFPALFSVLKTKERDKVRRLAPKRYFLMTSVGLTPQQKEQIAGLFDFVPLQLSDIFGRDDLNNLLGRHQDIERQHFKLWFSSVVVFEELLNARTRNFTRDTLRGIVEKARLYVQNPSFPQALDLLRRYNVCIVCGIPGIGKTTLAEMLVLHFAAQGYEVVRISGDISEAHNVQYQGVRRLFYYDDFLGQAVLGDKLNKNEDQRLIEFVQAIQKSETSKLILTTREYILNQARIEYERIAEWVNGFITCVLDLKKYTRRVRAQILFNHVFFSDLPPSHRCALVAHPEFVSLVDHRNYSPRIVQFMTDANRLDGTAPAGYFDYFKASLDNPQRLWEHAFRAISDEARNVVLTLFTLHSNVLLADLEIAFHSLHSERARSLNITIDDRDFDSSLKETEGNFTATDKSRRGTIISFHNPSIVDFVQNFLVSKKEVVSQLISSIVFLDQLERLWNYRVGKDEPPLFREIIESKPELLVRALQHLVESTRGRTVIPRPEQGSAKSAAHRMPETLAMFVASILRTYHHPEIEALLDGLIADIETRLRADKVLRFHATLLARALKKSKLFNTPKRKHLLSEIRDYLMKELEEWRDFEPLLDFLQSFPELLNDEDRKKIRVAFLECVDSEDSYFADPDTPEEIREDSRKLEDLADFLEIDVTDRILEMERRAEKIESESRLESDYGDGPRTSHFDSGRCSDEEIQSMFEIFRNGEKTEYGS